MNSVIVFLPPEVDGGSIRALIEEVQGLDRVTSAHASRGTQERVYWDTYLEVLREYEPEERAIAEVRTRNLTPWVFDYTGGVALVREIVAAVATGRWHGIWIDNDAEPMMSGDDYVTRLNSNPAWDWTALWFLDEQTPQSEAAEPLARSDRPPMVE